MCGTKVAEKSKHFIAIFSPSSLTIVEIVKELELRVVLVITLNALD